MSDIFVSYSSKDRPWVKVLAEALASQGWSVWWDRNTPTGTNYYRTIEHELDAARCVVVVWSQESVRSDWVPAEAQEGLKRNILIPIALEACAPPLVFRHLQTADLAGWSGDRSTETYRALVADIGRVLGQAPVPVSTRPAATKSGPSRTRAAWLLFGALALAGLGYGIWRMTATATSKGSISTTASPPTNAPAAAPVNAAPAPETKPRHDEPTAPPQEDPAVVIERLAAAWIAGWLRGDADTVIKLSSEPFFFDQKVVLTRDELKASYLRLFGQKGATWPQVEVTRIKVQTLREMQASGRDITHDRIYSSLNLTLDDYAVTVMLHAAGREEGMVMMARKTGDHYLIVGTWD